MPVVIKRLSNKEALVSAGLEAPVKLTSYALGTRVQIIAQSGPWKYVCKQGDTGVVLKIAKANSRPVDSVDDLYFVQLDTPRDEEKQVVYLTFKELLPV